MSFTYEQSKRGYANLYAKASIRPERRQLAHGIARRLNSNKVRYEKLPIPWFWVAITHQLESSGNFSRHLHNGDPLTARTKQVPAGRPVSGQPPFTWEESAADAIKLKGLQKIGAELSTVSRALYEFERYNGFGYVRRGINSPYLWSMTNLYSRGKYVADGRFDPQAVSQQCGAAAIMKAMEELKFVQFQAPGVPEAAKPVFQMDKPLPPIVQSPVKPRPQWDIVGWVINFVKGFFS